MVKKKLTLKELQSAVAREKSSLKTAQERRDLEKELKDLRAGTNTKLLRRLGRGFVVLTKKGASATGRGIRTASKFARESGAGGGLDNLSFASALPGGKKTTQATRPRARRGRVTTVIKTKRVIRRRVKAPKRRSRDNDFFGSLNI